MKLSVSLLVMTLVLGLLVALPATAADGDSFRLEALNGGRALEPGDLESGAVIVVFWAGWSPRCRDIAERTNAIVEEWGDRARVITVNFQEDQETAQDFVGDSLNADTYLDEDGSFSKQHTMTSLPGLLIYRDGEVVFRGKLQLDSSGLIAHTLD